MLLQFNSSLKIEMPTNHYFNTLKPQKNDHILSQRFQSRCRRLSYEMGIVWGRERKHILSFGTKTRDRAFPRDV